MATVPGATQEPIPDEHNVSRGCVELPPGVDPGSVFVFQYDETLKDRVESVYWRKYAITNDEVHDRECRREKIRQARATPSNPLKPYVGFRTSNVGAIRVIRTGRGHAFAVVHWPENGDLAHTHICIRPNGDTSVRKMKKSDIRELIHLLFKQFVQFEPHKCTS